MDFILYLDRVWLRYITELKFKRTDSGTKHVIGILKKALSLATEEPGFKTNALKEMILSGIAGLAGIGLHCSAKLDNDFCSEAIGCIEPEGKHQELAALVEEMSFNAKVPAHLKYLERWMGESPD